MNSKKERHSQINSLIQKFLYALKNYFQNSKKRRSSNTSCSSHQGYYEEAKKSQTQSRDLEKALKLYIKAIQNREKKDSTIKDFASSLHQLGYTRQAVRFMDDCEYYYDGNKEKYLRLRDNLSAQIRPTGKHECRYILLDNVPSQLKQIDSQEQLKNTLFKIPKRIKSIQYYPNLDLFSSPCLLPQCNNILLQFQSYSAAKKTLESFSFQQYFSIDLYWINAKNMKIVCYVIDGKKDFQEGLVVDDQILQKEMKMLGDQIWLQYGKQVYDGMESHGFRNLVVLHLLKAYEGKQYGQQQQKDQQEKKGKQDYDQYQSLLLCEQINSSLGINREEINKQNLFYQQYTSLKYYTQYDQFYTHYSYDLNQVNQYQNFYRT